MKYNPDIHHRHSIRLKGYEYTQDGAYFLTICTHQKCCLFGNISDRKMYLNHLGKIVAEEWLRSPQMREEIELDEWVIMPNHLHGIVWIKNAIEPPNLPHDPHNKNSCTIEFNRKPRSLSSFVGGFKSAVTRRIKSICLENHQILVWQRNYYETIIRDEKALNNIRQYIINNPLKWEQDPENIKTNSNEINIDFNLPF